MSTSKSSPTNTTSTNTTLQTTNENVSGNSGLTNLGGNVNFSSSTTTDTTAIDASTHVTTDFGAVQAGTGLSLAALDTVAAANRLSVDASQASERRIADIAGTSEDQVASAFGTALTSVQHNTDNTVSVVQNLAGLFGASLQTEFEDTQKQLGNVVSALGSTFAANNTSANAQVIGAVAQAGQQQADVIKYVALAAVAGLVVFLIFRK